MESIVELFMKLLSAALIILTLGGCGHTYSSYGDQLYYRPKNYDGPPYVITGRLDNEYDIITGASMNRQIIISVDDTEVIRGDLGADQSGAFVGKYEGNTINSECGPSNGEILCGIFFNGEKAGTL
jgi:hypothetical protein